MRYLAVLAVLILCGCSAFSKQNAELACPTVGLLPGADIVIQGGVQVIMNGFSATCSFDKKGESVVDLSLPFVARKTPGEATVNKDTTVRYFIAVLGPDENILTRESYTTTVTIAAKPVLVEERTVRIPVETQFEAANYKVAAGFILTPEQLAQNRDGNQSKKDKR